jgi:hypothetical protein
MDQKSHLLKLLQSTLNLLFIALGLVIITSTFLVYFMIDPTLSVFESKEDVLVSNITNYDNSIENGIHVSTGLIEAEGLMVVVNNCTNCHSSKLVIQNRMNAERWNTTIKWMQETQNLWDLGDNHTIIVNYLTTNYPPLDKGRRQNLSQIEWYELGN